MIFIFIAHRGNDNHEYKENSIDALIYCLNQEYIDGVELDIRITLDNKIVIYHDMLYKLKSIKKTKYKYLKLDLLDKFLKKINSNKIILIEIKGENEDTKILKYLYRILKKYNLNFYIFSFNYDLILKFKLKHKKYKCGLIVGNIINSCKNYDIFDFVAYKYTAYKKIDKPTFVWTINNINQYSKYIKKDVFIITDKSYLWYNLSR